MANGKYKKGLGSVAKKAGRTRSKPRGGRGVGRRVSGGVGSRLKKILGMLEHPTAAGQAKFGDVDVGGRGLHGPMSDKEADIAKRAAGY